MLGMVGDRACVNLLPVVFNASTLLERWGWTLLAERSCLGRTGLELEYAKELFRGAKGFLGAFAVMGVCPCGCLQ
jgi:hypothetical protein